MTARADQLPCLQVTADGGLLLLLHVQPRAAHNQVAGLQGEALKLRLTSPPVDGKANAELIAFLADHFGCRKQDVVIKSGAGGRMKLVTIRD